MPPIRRLLPLLLLAGCVTQPSLASRMAAYTGASAQALVQGLGVPDKQITVNGVQYLAYGRHRSVISPSVDFYGGFGPYFGGGPFYGGGFGGGGFYGSGLPQDVVDYSCETTFMLKNDRVFNFTLRGNDCG